MARRSRADLISTSDPIWSGGGERWLGSKQQRTDRTLPRDKLVSNVKTGLHFIAPDLKLARRIAVAFDGMRTAWREDGGARNQFIGAMAMLITLVVVQPSGFWWALAIFASLTVLAFELMNTALEGALDHVEKRNSEAIKKLKDIAAAAVMVASLGVLVIGIIMIASVFDIIR